MSLCLGKHLPPVGSGSPWLTRIWAMSSQSLPEVGRTHDFDGKKCLIGVGIIHVPTPSYHSHI